MSSGAVRAGDRDGVAGKPGSGPASFGSRQGKQDQSSHRVGAAGLDRKDRGRGACVKGCGNRSWSNPPPSGPAGICRRNTGFRQRTARCGGLCHHLKARTELPYRGKETVPEYEMHADSGTGAQCRDALGSPITTDVFRVVLSHSRKWSSQAVRTLTTEPFRRSLENALWRCPAGGGVRQREVGGGPSGLIGPGPESQDRGVLPTDDLGNCN
jgi:hypothetical protein